jgi:hypothetical protein
MKEHYINHLDNFIAGWYFEDTTICDDIIEWCKVEPNRGSGKIYNNTLGKLDVQKDVKDSIDSNLRDNVDLMTRYCDQLQKVCEKYIEKYPQCNSYSSWAITMPINVQHYPPGGGFHQWHTERFSATAPMSGRHLVFMTYLNDVQDGGETEFFHQKLKIKPEKGLTLIWGVDWTFTHRGILSPTQDKYIVTSWYNYLDVSNNKNFNINTYA